ncbi:MAG: Thiosulfate sulfurtransferase [Acidobacteria bacterium]|nr:Thiosulfate sulfurtransferase [Acidobacteriota bacterium]
MSVLIAPSELAKHLNNVVLLDARPAADYAAGHLAGARHASLDTQLSAASDPGFDAAHGGRHPLPPLDRWLAQLGAWGIGPSTHVVIYDDQLGANAAARAWWMLRAIGHESVQVLDGDWREIGSTTTELPQIESLPSYPATAWLLPTVDAARVDELRLRDDWRIIDVRSAPRFRGETEPIDPIAGHIPGAVNMPFAENLDGAHFKSPDALRAQYDALLDGVSANRVVVHCGSGVTACHTLLALEAAGISGASLYVGSWSEWCRNPLPREP